MSYRGKYTVKDTSKYLGDPKKVRFLSMWEYSLMKYLDACPSVVKWCSEDVIIDYICGTDGQQHKYMIDFYIILDSGKKLLIEVKPYKQTQEPKGKKRRTKAYLNECLVYVKNTSKWAAAKKFAELNGAEFQIWTENELRKLGIKIL